jgi:hypothetical protein
MVVLLALKRYEVSTGRIMFASSRPAIGAFFHRKLSWVEYVLPGLVRVATRRAYRFVRAVVRVWATRAARHVEQWLERALHRVRNTAPTLPHHRQSSAFLREVTEHKKEVQRGTPQKIVLEE